LFQPTRFLIVKEPTTNNYGQNVRVKSYIEFGDMLQEMGEKRNRSTQPQKVIQFYERDKPYFEFSNFADYPIYLDDEKWKTTEHYFQAHKFTYPKMMEQIAAQPTPRAAFDEARRCNHVKRSDWEQVKDDVMRRALAAKFTQHLDLQKLLINTEDAILIEHTPNDNYWGDGGGGGQNKLGCMLMELRSQLKREMKEPRSYPGIPETTNKKVIHAIADHPI